MAPNRLSRRVGLAYAAVCILWGSTYLAIAIGVHDLPPALFAGVRFLIAGALMLAFVRLSGRTLPSRLGDWGVNVGVGVLLLGVANGLVVWAVQFIASGIASIFVVTVSLWLAFFDAIIPGSRSRPTATQVAGLFIGFGGTVLLVGADIAALRQADWRGPLALTSAAAAWALGSIYAQRRQVASGPYANAAIQMLAGGLLLTLLGTARGEWARFALTWSGSLAIAYLVIFGSLIGFTAYVLILREMSATVAGTYAYANTVVAVLLGWLVLGEPVTARTLSAMAIVLSAVVIVKSWPRQDGPESGRGLLRSRKARRKLLEPSS